MKFKITATICLSQLTLSHVMFAQDAPVSPYIFPSFVKSTVLQKGGASVAASLNYNTITQEMLFEKDGGKLVLDPNENIDTIFIQNRKFILTKQGYLEKLSETPVTLYVQYKSEAVRVSKQSEEANKVLSKSYKTGSDGTIDIYGLKLPENYKLQTDNKYWFQKDSKFVQASTIKKFIALFPEKEAQITEYAVKNKINLNAENDLVKLITYVSQ